MRPGPDPVRSALPALLLALLVAMPGGAGAGPAVFWASSPLQPGDTALFYGDGLETADAVRFVRLADGPAEEPGREPRAGDPGRGVGAKPVQPSPWSVNATRFSGRRLASRSASARRGCGSVTTASRR
jgi:hypothetical protein